MNMIAKSPLFKYTTENLSQMSTTQNIIDISPNSLMTYIFKHPLSDINIFNKFNNLLPLILIHTANPTEFDKLFEEFYIISDKKKDDSIPISYQDAASLMIKNDKYIELKSEVLQDNKLHELLDLLYAADNISHTIIAPILYALINAQHPFHKFIYKWAVDKTIDQHKIDSYITKINNAWPKDSNFQIINAELYKTLLEINPEFNNRPKTNPLKNTITLLHKTKNDIPTKEGDLPNKENNSSGGKMAIGIGLAAAAGGIALINKNKSATEEELIPPISLLTSPKDNEDAMPSIEPSVEPSVEPSIEMAPIITREESKPVVQETRTSITDNTRLNNVKVIDTIRESENLRAGAPSI